MHSKGPILAFDATRNPKKQLQSLYVRRHALDDLIRSLEVYDRFRERRPVMPRRKSA